MKNFFRKPEPETPAEPTGPSRGTVLVIDDSPTETRIFVTTLTRAGYRVETAPDGEQGVELARRIRPDLILMDVIMPVLNGFQATRMLHRDAATADIPVVMVTTKDQPTDRTWGLRQGAVEYLVKPVDPAELVQRVTAILGG
jgi:twitching motility two-component system response regulator PilH